MSGFKEKLENKISDLTSLEVAILESGNETGLSEKKVLTYSMIQVEGDGINIIDSELNSSETDIIDFHKSMMINSQKGRSAFLSFAYTTLKSIL